MAKKKSMPKIDIPEMSIPSAMPTDHLLINVTKKMRELGGQHIEPMGPAAMPELGPPGSSSGLHGSAGMGGYDIARGKKKKRGGGNYA